MIYLICQNWQMPTMSPNSCQCTTSCQTLNYIHTSSLPHNCCHVTSTTYIHQRYHILVRRWSCGSVGEYVCQRRHMYIVRPAQLAMSYSTRISIFSSPSSSSALLDHCPRKPMALRRWSGSLLQPYMEDSCPTSSILAPLSPA